MSIIGSYDDTNATVEKAPSLPGTSNLRCWDAGFFK